VEGVLSPADTAYVGVVEDVERLTDKLGGLASDLHYQNVQFTERGPPPAYR